MYRISSGNSESEVVFLLLVISVLAVSASDSAELFIRLEMWLEES